MNTENLKAVILHTLQTELESSQLRSDGILNSILLENRILRMQRDALKTIAIHAAETFRVYEELHSEKGTPEGDQKAAANRNLAVSIESVLATIDAKQI